VHKISHKLIFAFGALIAVLLIEMILNQVITRQATDSYEKLKTEVGPAVRMLDKFQAVNKELILLALNKVNAPSEISHVNRMKVLTEVELPHYIMEVFHLQEILMPSDPKVLLSKDIISHTHETIEIVKEINILLLTNKDYQDSSKVNSASEKVNNSLAQHSFLLDNGINGLQLAYNSEFEKQQAQLSNRLNSFYNIILITGMVGILIGLIIAFQTIKAITSPIEALEASALRISVGDYDTKIDVKGKSELDILGNSFNKMARALKRSFEDIQRKNKELEQFVYIASHDLQEPLRTIDSFTKLLQSKKKVQHSEQTDMYLNFMSEASSRMIQLIKGLLDYSRIGKVDELKTVDCSALVNDVKNDLAAIIIDTNTTVDIDALPQIQGFDMELRLLFQNLISNAIKFRKPHIDPIIKISALENEDSWKFSVRDNGIGMQEDHKKKIFLIFQRLHGRGVYEGTGIGLAHCQKIIDMHGGKIWVDSVVGKGSDFQFTIPKQTID